MLGFLGLPDAAISGLTAAATPSISVTPWRHADYDVRHHAEPALGWGVSDCAQFCVPKFATAGGCATGARAHPEAYMPAGCGHCAAQALASCEWWSAADDEEGIRDALREVVGGEVGEGGEVPTTDDNERRPRKEWWEDQNSPSAMREALLQSVGAAAE